VVSLIRGGERSLERLGGDQAEWPMPAEPDWLRRLAATPIILLVTGRQLASVGWL
jgi:hypothetical protein